LACGSATIAQTGSSTNGGPAATERPLGTEATSGIATYYAATGEGSCSFEASSNLDVAAFDSDDFAGSRTCGTCLQVRGPKGSVTVRVVDSCPDCQPHHLDLAESAFTKIADREAGRVPIVYQAVTCKGSGPMTYRLKEGTSQYWTAIRIGNHNLPIAKVEYKKGNQYKEITRSEYNYFVEPDGVGESPNGLTLRITAIDGQVLDDVVPRLEAGTTFEGSVQFR
jgi:expansin (peptidoglycan-binding protein)